MLRNLPQDEFVQRVNEALRALPWLTRRVFELHCFDDKSYAEIAVELRLDARTVEQHLAIAMVRLDRAIHGQP